MVYSAACGMKVSAGNDDAWIVWHVHLHVWFVLFYNLFSFLLFSFMFEEPNVITHKFYLPHFRCNKWHFYSYFTPIISYGKLEMTKFGMNISWFVFKSIFCPSEGILSCEAYIIKFLN